jgi:flavin reductase (DIM6/NTAB) family NADH-FMN oxidoreductase RutF
MIDHAEFRRVMGHFATGVSVVTTVRPDGGPCGLTVSSVASVSLDPPLVLVCIDRAADSHDCIAESGFFAVSFLPSEGGESLARRFSAWDIDEKFAGVAYSARGTGAPVLDGALAWIDCRVAHALPGGDHTIYVGRVEAADAHEGVPLVYYRGGYGRFVP